MAIALVTTVTAGSANTNDVTTGAIDTTGASLLVVMVGNYSVGSAATVTDSKSNTWTGLTEQAEAAHVRGRLYYCANPTVGSGHTFTATASGSYPSVSVGAFSGVKLSSPFDLQNGTHAGSGTSAQSGSITPSEANCLVIAGIGIETGTTYTINGGFSAVSKDYSPGAYFGSGLAYLIQTAAAAANPTWSWVTSGANAPVIASFKAAFNASWTRGSNVLLGAA